MLKTLNIFFNLFFNLKKSILIINKNGEFKYLINLFLFIFSFSILYTLFILYFLFYIYKNNKRKNNLNKNYLQESIIKDLEFILFKNNVFKVYYSTIIVLFIFIFRSFNIKIFLAFNYLSIYIFYYLFPIFIICAIALVLFSNKFILILFKFYTNIQVLIKSLNEFKLYSTDIKFNIIKPVLFTQRYCTRSFSTSSINNY